MIRPNRLHAGRILAFAAISALAPAPAPAQEQASREERLKAHRARIDEIISKRNKEKEEEAKRQSEASAAAAAAPASQPGAAGAAGAAVPQLGTVAAPGQTLSVSPPPPPGSPPLGPPGRPGAFPPPGGLAGQPNAAGSKPGGGGSRAEARAIVFMYPYDSTVDVGETFVTELCADARAAKVGKVSLRLRYPPETLNPLTIDHTPLDSLADGEVSYSYDAARAEIRIEAKLRTPQPLAGRPLAKITWEALAPTPGSTLRFVTSTPGQPGTSLIAMGQDVLGTSEGAGDGVVNATVMVRDRRRGPEVRPAGPGGQGLVIAPREAVAAPPSMGLSLVPSANALSVGRQFHVDVVLSNPRRDPFDRLSLYLQFDPDKLEVVDADSGNAFRSGVNIEDGFAARMFPFGNYAANGADNRAGTIDYVVGAGTAPLREGGVLARIHFVAKADAERSEVALVRNAPGMEPSTDVSLAGTSMLTGAPARLTALAGVAVAIDPAAPGALERAAVEQDRGQGAQSGVASGNATMAGRGVIVTGSGISRRQFD